MVFVVLQLNKLNPILPFHADLSAQLPVTCWLQSFMYWRERERMMAPSAGLPLNFRFSSTGGFDTAALVE
jgi:hypothetical protein